MKMFCRRIEIKEILFFGSVIILSSCLSSKGNLSNTITLENRSISLKGNGEISAALQAAIARASENDTIIFPEGTNNIERTIKVNKSLIFMGRGMERTILKGKSRLFEVDKSRIKEVIDYRPKIIEGTDIIYIDTRKMNIETDDLICFKSKELFEEQATPYNKEHCNKVSFVDADKIILEEKIPISFSGDVEIEVYDPLDIEFRKLSVIGRNDLYLVSIDHARSVIFDSVYFTTEGGGNYGRSSVRHHQSGTSALALYHSTNISVQNSKFENVWYGVLTHKGCTGIKIIDCEINNSRHLNNTALGSTNLFVSNCTALNCQGGFDSHETAISSQFVNCRDINPSMPSKFRGRIDILENCQFDGSIVMTYDPNFIEILKKNELLTKIVEGSTLKGHSKFEGANISIMKSEILGTVEFQKNVGKISISDCTIKIEENPNSKLRPEALTIGTNPKAKQSYTFEVTNCSISTSEFHPIGIYIPHQGSVMGIIVNTRITGFDKGLVLYGGREAAPRYERLHLNKISIVNCNVGLYHQDIAKNIGTYNIYYADCNLNVNFPTRIIDSKK